MKIDPQIEALIKVMHNEVKSVFSVYKFIPVTENVQE